jgi:hypothetical protein
MNTVKFGIARRNINPQVPVSLAGYFNIRMWKSVSDDLEVRVLSLEQNGTAAFIIQYDLITVSDELYQGALAAFKDAGFSAIRPDNLIMTATHTHTGPEVRSNRNGSASEYLPYVIAQTVEAVREAMSTMTDGTLSRGITSDARFIFNRRYWMKNGTVVTNPGKLNPNIRTSEGDIDPEIPILAISQAGKIKVLLLNIVNHTDTIGGNSVSADWAGFTVRTLQAELGAGSVVMPLIGCSGNINHFDVSTNMVQTHYPEAERIGKGYAETVSKALPSLQAFSADLKTFGKSIPVDRRRLSRQEIADAQAVMDKYPEIEVVGVSGADLTSEDLARQTPFALKYFAYNLLSMRESTEPFNITLTGISFGEAVIASLPGEPFVEIGLALRKDIFHGKLAFAVSHGNGGSSGYIPNPWNYGRGGYETTPRSNPFDTMAASKLLNVWREIIR